MSNDPRPTSEESAGSAQEADYLAVYAELAETERGRNFLTEHARRHGQPDIHRLLSTVARLEATVRQYPPAEMAAALASGVADLTAAIAQIEAALAVGELSAADGVFAAERVQDIVLALRHHGVAVRLCDALEVGVRELGDAVVGGKAAAKRALGGAALARDLARRLSEMVAHVGAVPFDDGGLGSSADQASARSSAEASCPGPATPRVPGAPSEAPLHDAAREAGGRPCAPSGQGEPAGSSAPDPALPPADDPFAAVVALSEEELIALFS